MLLQEKNALITGAAARFVTKPAGLVFGWIIQAVLIASGFLEPFGFLVGIAFASKVWWIDAALGLVVAAILFYATYQIIRQTVDKLLGENPSPELIEEVRQIAAETCHDELQVHHLHLHNYVNHKELTLHIKMDGTKSLEECHAVATLLEENIKAKLGVETTIHLEPLGQEHDSD